MLGCHVDTMFMNVHETPEVCVKVRVTAGGEGHPWSVIQKPVLLRFSYKITKTLDLCAASQNKLIFLLKGTQRVLFHRTKDVIAKLGSILKA